MIKLPLNFKLKLLNAKIIKFCFIVVITLLFTQILWMFLPFLKSDVLVINDYINIPEETRIEGKYIDNSLVFMHYNPEIGFSGLEKYFNSFKSANDFVVRNSQEMVWQTQCGWFMHHHSSLLSGINQLALGKNMNEINQQYGILSTITLTFFMKLFGGVTFDNYIKVLYSFYPLFYLVFFVVIFYLFKDVKYVFLAFLSAVSFLFQLSFTSIYLAPGFNPIRQIFYLFVVLILFIYFERRHSYLLALLSLLSLLSIFNNKEFGIPILGALLVTFITYYLFEKKENRYSLIVFLILTIVLSAFLVFFAQRSSNPLGKYYLMGLSGPLINKSLLKFILLSIIFVYVVILKLFAKNTKLKYISIFMFFYVQGTLVYFIWNPVPNHFFSIGTPIIILVLILLKMFFEKSRVSKFENPFIILVAIFIFIFLYLPSLSSYRIDATIYQQIANTHKVYRWGLPKAKIRSTMNPLYFEESSALIQKYSDGKNSIYLISQYDNFLPFLANKYSAMPFDEVAISLLTEREVGLCIDRILIDKPKYIFVDTGIDHGIYSKSGNKAIAFVSSYYDLSAKIKMWEELRKVYLGIKDSYQLVEKGSIISVYERI